MILIIMVGYIEYIGTHINRYMILISLGGSKVMNESHSITTKEKFGVITRSDAQKKLDLNFKEGIS